MTSHRISVALPGMANLMDCAPLKYIVAIDFGTARSGISYSIIKAEQIITKSVQIEVYNSPAASREGSSSGRKNQRF